MAEASTTSSPLLKLPGELRNRIYECTVKNADDIEITTNRFPEPPLLAVCKQVREDASEIFYKENQFTVVTTDYDSTAMMTYRQKKKAVEKRYDIKMTAKLDGINRPNWPNLLAWLRRVHKYQSSILQLHGLPADDKWSPKSIIIKQMFHAASHMQDRPWEEVEQVVESQHRMLVLLDRKWT